MGRLLLVLCAAALAASLTSAQEFPAPGTGIFTWQPVTDRPLKADALAFGPSGVFYANSRDTVYAYAPAPEGPPMGHWNRLGYTRLFINTILPLDSAGDTLLVGRVNGGLLSRSTDGGATWADVNGCYTCGSGSAPSAPDGFLALPSAHPHAGRILAGNVMRYSDDRGATWTNAAQSFPGETGLAHVFALMPSGRVLMGGSWGVAASDDGGTSYAVTALYGDYHYEVYGLTAAATPGSTQSGAPACGLPDLTLCDGAVVVGIDVALLDIQAYWTNDGGRSWSSGTPLPQPYDGIYYGLVGGVVAAGTDPATGLERAVTVLGRGMVYASPDGGQTWAAVGRLPLDISEGAHFAKHVLLGPDGHLWVTTRRAGARYDDAFVFRSAEPASAAFPVAGEASPSPSGARLDVRPNPASGAISVRLSLDAPTPSAVLAVYDALGRRVALLHDGPLAAGERSFAVDTTGLPAGVYRVRFEGDGTVATTPLTVLH